jgi:hypothetical protein
MLTAFLMRSHLAEFRLRLENNGPPPQAFPRAGEKIALGREKEGLGKPSRSRLRGPQR